MSEGMVNKIRKDKISKTKTFGKYQSGSIIISYHS